MPSLSPRQWHRKPTCLKCQRLLSLRRFRLPSDFLSFVIHKFNAPPGHQQPRPSKYDHTGETWQAARTGAVFMPQVQVVPSDAVAEEAYPPAVVCPVVSRVE
jgi:hypothetical protein